MRQMVTDSTPQVESLRLTVMPNFLNVVVVFRDGFQNSDAC
jgi:hypothetical protein